MDINFYLRSASLILIDLLSMKVPFLRFLCINLMTTQIEYQTE